ncbi:MAG: transporter substrate-binding domain-containing protein [Desulfobacteraceae bacterium]
MKSRPETSPIRECSTRLLKSLLSRIACCLLLAQLMFVLPLPGLTGFAHGQEVVRLATLNWAPYIGENLPEQGYAAELIRAAFARSGHEVKFLFMPWKRAVETVTKGHYDGLAPVYFTKQRQADFSMTDAFPAGPLVFAKRKGSPIEFTSIPDLKPYKIACVRGYANTQAFDSAKYLQKSMTNNDTTGYRRLLFGSVDLWLADKFVAQYTMANHLPERAAEIEFIKKPLGVKNLYIIFTKKKPYHVQLTKDFNKGLDAVLNDGTLQAILGRHNLSLD